MIERLVRKQLTIRPLPALPDARPGQGHVPNDDLAPSRGRFGRSGQPPRVGQNRGRGGFHGRSRRVTH